MEETIEYNGKTITKNQFIGAMYQYGEVGGHSIDQYIATMTWYSVLNNDIRQGDSGPLNGKLERDIWLPVLEEYL